MTGPSSLPNGSALHATKRRLLDAGLATLLERGYNATGIQDLLVATGVPKGSFYHHFASKEDFALQVIERYAAEVNVLLERALAEPHRSPVERIRLFFEQLLSLYAAQGYLGSLPGILAQELCVVSTSFRRRLDAGSQALAIRLAEVLSEAQARDEVAADADPLQTATFLLDCWEGAAMRSRLQRSAAPLEAMLTVTFRGSVPVAGSPSADGLAA